MTDLEQIKEDLRLIKTALFGLPDIDMKGVVERLKSHEKFIQGEKDAKNKRIGFFAGISFTGGMLGNYIKTLFGF